MKFTPELPFGMKQTFEKTDAYKVDIDNCRSALWAKMRQEIPPEYRWQIKENIIIRDNFVDVILQYIPLGE